MGISFLQLMLAFIPKTSTQKNKLKRTKRGHFYACDLPSYCQATIMIFSQLFGSLKSEAFQLQHKNV